MPAKREDVPLEGQVIQEIIPSFITLQEFHNNYDNYDISTESVRMPCKRGVSETSTLSTHSYINYRKLVNNNLAKINRNISEMLIESFKGIDSICTKVRECISDFQPVEPPEPTIIPTYTESFADDGETQKMTKRQKAEQQKTNYNECTTRCEEPPRDKTTDKPPIEIHNLSGHNIQTETKNRFRDKSRGPKSNLFEEQTELTNTFQNNYHKEENLFHNQKEIKNTEKSIRSEKRPQSKEELLFGVELFQNQCFDGPNHPQGQSETSLFEEITQVDEIHETPVSLSLIESVNSIDKTTYTDDITITEDEVEKCSEKKKTVECTPIRARTQYYTEIEFMDNVQDLGDTIEKNIDETLNDISEMKNDETRSSSESQKRRGRLKTKMERNKRRRTKKTLEDYTQDLKKEVDSKDFNSLQEIIQNLTERIDMLSNQSMGTKYEKQTKPTKQTKAKDNKKRKSSRATSKGSSTVSNVSTGPAEVSVTKEDKSSIKKKKSIRNLLGSALSNALAVKTPTTAKGKARLNLTEVYQRPAVTNLHKRLVAQLEANDSFLCFQRLMSKHQTSATNEKIFPNINLPLSVVNSLGIEKRDDSKSTTYDMRADQKFQEFQEVPIEPKNKDLRTKYADSLWFGEKKMFKDKSSKNNQHKEKNAKSHKSAPNYSSATSGTDTDKSVDINRRRGTNLYKTHRSKSTISKSTVRYKLPSKKKFTTENAYTKSIPYCSNMNSWFNNSKRKTNEKVNLKKRYRKPSLPTKTRIQSNPARLESSTRPLPTVKPRAGLSIYHYRAMHNFCRKTNPILRVNLNSANTLSTGDSSNHTSIYGSRAKKKPQWRPTTVGHVNTSNSSLEAKHKTDTSLRSSTPKSRHGSRNAFCVSNMVLTHNYCSMTKQKFKGSSSNHAIVKKHRSAGILPVKTYSMGGGAVSNDSNPSRTTVKTKVQWMRPKNDTQMPTRKLEYLDILDDLTHKDLLPLRSEYPRKDMVADGQNRHIQETYLWKMMYGKEKNNNIWSHLIQPNGDSKDKNLIHSERHEKERWVPVDNRRKSSRERDLSSKKERDLSSKSTLFDLTEKGTKKLKSESHFEESEKCDRMAKQKSKRKAIEKLTPYLFDPKGERNNQTLIVMPVRVFYDNPPIQIIKDSDYLIPEVMPKTTPKSVKTAKVPKLLLPAMKEIKPVHRAKWSCTVSAKPKRKIDSIQKDGEGSNPKSPRIEISEKEKSTSPRKEINAFTTKNPLVCTPTYDPMKVQKETLQEVAYKKAIMRNLNRMVNIRERERKNQQHAVKDVPVLLQTIPHYARPTIQSQNYFQKTFTQDQKHEIEKKGTEARSRTNSPKTSPKVSATLSEFDIKIVNESPKSDFERKMLSFKYGKSVGEKLVSFLNSQPPSPHLRITPELPNPSIMAKNVGTMGSRYPSPTDAKSYSPSRGKSRSPIGGKSGEPSTNQPVSVRHNQMLMHLRGLKQKNTKIQTNIQKAIGVIETKMVDLLSTPGDSASVEAFDVMEKEITTVLDMMKNEGLEAARGNRPKMQDEFETISKELFSKLERILDSERSKETSSTSEMEGKESARSCTKEKPKLADKLLQSSSVTTVSADESYNTPRRHLKRKNRKSSLSSTNLEELKYSHADKDIVAAENEFAMGENVKKSDSITEHIYDQKEDIERDQGDQPEKENDKKINNEQPENDLDIIWDTAEQLQRLEKILRESNDLENANDADTFEEALKKEQEILKITTPLDTFENAIDEEYDEESKEQLDFLNSRINALLESPRKEVSSISHDEKLSTQSNIHRLSTSPRKEENSSSHETLSPHKQSNSPLREDIWATPCTSSSPRKEDPSMFENKTSSSHHLDVISTNLEVDELVSSSLEEFMTAPDTEIKLSPIDELSEKCQNPIVPDSEGSCEDLSDEVDKVIKRVEYIYAQLDDFQINDEQVPVFSDAKSIQDVPSEEFLTPFMHAVRDNGTRKSAEFRVTEGLETTPSYFNILSFLDSLNEIENEKVQTPTLNDREYSFYQASTEYPIQCATAEKPSCLKKAEECKHKKRVSFLVQQESKCAQASKDKAKQRKIPKEKFMQFKDTSQCSVVKSNLEGSLDEMKPVCVNKEVQNVHESKTTQVLRTESLDALTETGESEKVNSSDDSFFSAIASTCQSPRLPEYHNASDESMSENTNDKNEIKGNYGTDIVRIKNRNLKFKKKSHDELIRDISSVSNLLKRPKNLENFSQRKHMQLIPSREKMIDFKNNNVVFLKSFYAFMYILIFTALNMEYKCY